MFDGRIEAGIRRGGAKVIAADDGGVKRRERWWTDWAIAKTDKDRLAVLNRLNFSNHHGGDTHDIGKCGVVPLRRTRNRQRDRLFPSRSIRDGYPSIPSFGQREYVFTAGCSDAGLFCDTDKS